MEIEGYIPGPTSYTQVVGVMSRYARAGAKDQRIKNLAHHLTKDVQDDRSKMLAILNWILSNMSFVEDDAEARRIMGGDVQETDEIELVKSPVAVLETRRYDCDCIATFIASLLIVLGIGVKFRLVAFQEEQPNQCFGYEHVFAQGYDRSLGQWIIIDPVAYPNERSMMLDTRHTQEFSV